MYRDEESKAIALDPCILHMGSGGVMLCETEGLAHKNRTTLVFCARSVAVGDEAD